MSDELRINSYYYSFSPTGDRAIDLILSAVATAGKMSHHTDGWDDDLDHLYAAPSRLRGNSMIDCIQNAANDAANTRADTGLVEELSAQDRAELEAYREMETSSSKGILRRQMAARRLRLSCAGLVEALQATGDALTHALYLLPKDCNQRLGIEGAAAKAQAALTAHEGKK